MIVKELLIESLTRANHVQRGFSPSAKEIDGAIVHFNSQLRKYSDQNLITAYQKILDITPTQEVTTIGKPVEKDGLIVHYATSSSSLPSANTAGFEIGRDFGVVIANSALNCYTLSQVTTEAKAWIPTTEAAIFDMVADCNILNVSRIMSAMVKDALNHWQPLEFKNLTEFYLCQDSRIYNSAPLGENLVDFRTKCVNQQVKIIYNSSMKFDKNDTLQLPEAHIELLTLATTCAILREDCDSDQTQLNNYMTELTNLEKQIIATTSSTRRITRESNGYEGMNRIDYLKSGVWILRG